MMLIFSKIRKINNFKIATVAKKNKDDSDEVNVSAFDRPNSPKKQLWTYLKLIFNEYDQFI